MIDLQPLPMKEAQQFWRDKVPMSPGQFRQLSDEAKTRAFAVSGMAKGDELTTVMQAVQRSIDKGTTFDDFKTDCAATLERRGWTGDQAFRLDNIFRTNIQTAYNVGRYKQMVDVKESRPYWQYSAVNDRRTRPTHAALNGKVFPADHPFWQKWYPPNGFRCRCSVVTLSKQNVREEKMTIEKDDPTGKLIEPRDPVTGYKLPARPLMPDQGFAHNPGQNFWGGIVDAADEQAKAKMTPLPGLKTAADYGRRMLKNVRSADIADLSESALLPGGKDDAFYRKEFVARYGTEKVVKDAAGDAVILSERAFLADKTPGAQEEWKFKKAGHGISIPLMEEMLQQPYEIWLTPQKDLTGKIRLSRRYIGFWKTADIKRIGGLAVYEVVGGVFQGVTNFIPLAKGEPQLDYVERLREGLLLYKKGK